MKATDFAYWLQGVFELGDIKSFDEKQTAIIKRHLAMVFYHDIDPSAGKSEQDDLSKLHESGSLISKQPASFKNKHQNFDGVLARC